MERGSVSRSKILILKARQFIFSGSAWRSGCGSQTRAPIFKLATMSSFAKCPAVG